MSAKLSNVCVAFIIGLSLCSSQETSLCSFSKLDIACRCEYKTCEFSHFPELYVDCRWKELEDFPQSNQFPPDLSHLDLSYNNVETLRNEFNNNALVELILSYNGLNYVNSGFFRNLSNLKILELSHNSIYKLDSNVFNGLTKLTTLDLSYNKLTVLPENLFTPVRNLEVLKVGYNNIGKYLTGITNIFEAEFDLTDNIFSLNLDKLELKLITATFFGDSTSLKHLSMADNIFDDIPPIPTSVTNFDFSGNNVTILTVKHLNYRNLKVLRLNRMKNLQAIDIYALYNMPDLEELYMENCPNLKELNDIAFGVIRSDPDDLKLKRMSFSRSGLQGINETYLHLFKKLDYIDLQNNPWTCDCNILWMQILKYSFHKSENMRCALPSILRDEKVMNLNKTHLPNCLSS